MFMFIFSGESVLWFLVGLRPQRSKITGLEWTHVRAQGIVIDSIMVAIIESEEITISCRQSLLKWFLPRSVPSLTLRRHLAFGCSYIKCLARGMRAWNKAKMIVESWRGVFQFGQRRTSEKLTNDQMSPLWFHLKNCALSLFISLRI